MGSRRVTRPWTTLGHETCTLSPMARWLNHGHVFTIVCMDEVKWKVLGVEDSLLKVKKWRLVIYIAELLFTTTGSCRLFCSTLPVYHLQKLITGWVGPSRSAYAMPWLLARQRSVPTRELMNDDLRLPRLGIEPRPHGFREVGSTTSPLPLLSSVQLTWLTLFWVCFTVCMLWHGEVTWAIHIGSDDC